MNGKIILNLAISLDGYIADEEGGFDWIVGDGSDTLNTKNKIDFDKFLEGIDVVVMGRNCYNQNFHNEYKDKDVYIATSDDIEDYENYHFIKGDICKQISDLKEEGKNIFLFGGGKMIDPFIKDDIIDEYIIGIIPTILGKGRRLFLGNNPKIDLKLQQYSVEDGIVVMRYSKRNMI
ncbi:MULTISPECIES: dihydrofolate reductase family protein [Clostridium]|uniref:dihydrofolate reductase family protein n=1 Tax=Clostridium TaxID=1485 RepID=UPI0006BF9BDF|nr:MULTISPECIES: dihydrofolate reductase family protein [Clostridium]MDU1937916.1 dihydrofolate reductase family protein [Clostridium sp.]MDU2046361.1 dihydrofolate reductase family protein [Clostridium sp.]CUP98688.1 riboflavin biosynthesis protein RibD C-domain-containing protein [Clostridium paraputrificum]